MLLCVHVTSVLFLVLAALTLWASIEVTLVVHSYVLLETLMHAYS